MAAVESGLGDFVFVNLSRVEARQSGPPLTEHEQLMPIQRPGVDGTAFLLLGRKGQPFQMRSFATAATLSTAEGYEALYREYIGTTQVMTWGGSVVTSAAFVIVEVQVIRCQRCGASTSGHGAFVEAIWTLIPVDPSL